MKTRRFLSLVAIFALALAFFACSGDSPTEPQGGESSEGSQVNNSLPKIMQTVIGYGYDASQHYASSPDIRRSVLNQDALIAAKRILEDPNLVSGVFNTITGSDVNNYRSELTKKVSANVKGGYGPASFKVEAGENFGQDRIQNSNFVFATSSMRISKGAYHISNRDGLDAFFTEEFKKDLNSKSMTAEDIVTKYGTHVMLGGVMGARLDHHLSTVARSQTDINNLGYYVNASANVKVGLGGGAEYQQDQKIKNSFDTTKTEINTIAFGGKPQYVYSIHLDGSNPEAYKAWINSIDGNEIWSDYYPNSLFGIWALPMDAARSADLLAEVERRCAPTEISQEELATTTALVTVRTKETSSQITDDGWYSNVYDVINFADFNVNLDTYKAQGYTKITFYIKMSVKEYDDGYQYIGLWSSSVTNDTYKLAEQMFEHGGTSKETSWGDWEFTFPNININKFENKGSGYQFVIRYNADGWLGDNWGNKDLKVRLTFSK